MAGNRKYAARQTVADLIKTAFATGDDFGTIANADELTEIKKSEFVALTEEA